MPDENEYEEALDFFVSFEGVSKRALNIIPKNTLLALKGKIDSEYFSKEEILKEFIKKEIVMEKYMKIADVEKNYTPNDKVPEILTYKESNIIKCKECGETNFDFMYDHEGKTYVLVHCIYCGADLRPPTPPKIIKKYETRPKTEKKATSTKYRTR